MTPAAPTALPQMHLAAGQVLVTRDPQVIVTVLGSCVAVTMFDPQSQLAAICHAMLAQPKPTEVLRADDPARYRYASHAVPAMIAAFRRAGVRSRAVEVKIFGGGNVIGHRPLLREAGGWFGAATVETARELLEGANLVIAAENTGGRYGRKILFNTATGEVLHKQLGHGVALR